MVKKLLKSKKGESLVETLCAVLIFTMASIGLYSMILASSRTNATVKQKDKDIQTHIVTAEQAPASNKKAGTVVVTIESSGGSSAHAFPIEVYVYGDGSEDNLYSYFKK